MPNEQKLGQWIKCRVFSLHTRCPKRLRLPEFADGERWWLTGPVYTMREVRNRARVWRALYATGSNGARGLQHNGSSEQSLK